MKRCWSKFIAGAPWKRTCERYGIKGYVRAFEITHGENGFHPHWHAVLFIDGELTADEHAELQLWMALRWRRIVIREMGGKHAPDLEHGLDLTRTESPEYISKTGLDTAGKATRKGKLGMELAGTHTKGSAMIHIGLRGAEGCKKSAAVFREYAAATKGTKHLQYSKGLRDALGLDDELSDDELAELPSEDFGAPEAMDAEVFDTLARMRGVAPILEAKGAGRLAEFIEEHLPGRVARTVEQRGVTGELPEQCTDTIDGPLWAPVRMVVWRMHQ
jgi:hypothetical protein